LSNYLHGAKMGLRERIADAEKRLSAASAPLTKEEYAKWWQMFMEERGTGSASDQTTFTEDEWKWYGEHRADFEKTYEVYRDAGIITST